MSVLQAHHQALADFWTPAQLAVPPRIWLDDQSAVTDESGFASQWDDRSGNGTHFTQASVSQQPQILANELVGRRVIRFDGSNDVLRNTSPDGALIFSGATSGWALSVYRRRATTSRTTTIFNSRTSSGAAARFGAYSGSARGQNNRPALAARRNDGDSVGVLDSVVSTGTVWSVVLFVMDWATGLGSIYIDGNDPDSATITSSGQTATSASGGGIYVGSEVGTGYGDIDLAALLVGVNSLPPEDEIDRLFGWAVHRYGLQAKLPGGHPYKNHAP